MPRGPSFQWRAATARCWPTRTSGSAFYDGLQAKLTKQLTSHLSLLLTYTWSHDINTVEWDGTGQNPNDYSCIVVCEKATSLLNQTNRASLSGTYTLPWGFMVSAWAQLGSGFPYNVTTGVDNNGDGNTSDRPVVNGVVVPRDWGQAPAIYDFDFALQKAFRIKERTQSEPAGGVLQYLQSPEHLQP